MSHWFDTLARPHTRRTALKSAGVAGAGLLLGIGRPPAARADSNEPCYLPCLEIALGTRELNQERCDKLYGQTSKAEYLPIVGGILNLIHDWRYASCRADASTRFAAANGRCLYEPECGDPKSYPGGAAPIPVPVKPPGCGPDSRYVVCDPGPVNPPGCGSDGKYVACGDQPCCNLAYATCVSCNKGPVCCRINGNCCG
jgi:hypothetical protein